MQHRLGLIGAGKNARNHALYYADRPDVDLVAIADPDPAARARLADQVNARGVADYTQLLDDVDAVVISSPNFLHAEHAIACARAGKHVYIEKPIGLNLDQTEAVTHAVRQAGIASAVGFSVRLTREVQTLLRLTTEGQIGQLASIWSRRLVYLPDDMFRGWRADPDRSGGLLMEVNIHELDWMRLIGGPVESVYARTAGGTTERPRANDHVWATLNFKNSAVGTHEGGWRCANTNFYKGVCGTVGGAATNEWGQGLVYTPLGGAAEPVELDEPMDLRGRWLNAIAGGPPVPCDADWGMEIMRIAEAVLRSAETGQVIRLDEVKGTSTPNPALASSGV
ncbi:MAG: Gfo/Idh/MocA family oxidoreductase [Planctomycetota bacterium]